MSVYRLYLLILPRVITMDCTHYSQATEMLEDGSLMEIPDTIFITCRMQLSYVMRGLLKEKNESICPHMKSKSENGLSLVGQMRSHPLEIFRGYNLLRLLCHQDFRRLYWFCILRNIVHQRKLRQQYPL